MIHFIVKNTSNEVIVSNMVDECYTCLESCNTPGKVIEICPKYQTKRRFGVNVNNRGKTFICCDRSKTTKLFRDKLESLSYTFHDLVTAKLDIENEVKKVEQLRVNRLVHNLTSINAHNIQEVYDLVPQEILAADHNNQIKHIVKELERNPKKAALMFLRIAKHNIHMKSEFSIYKKLDRSDATLDRRPHPIRKVILNILHTFFADFNDNDIYVDINNDYDGLVKIDYESIQVALYHFIENAHKYTKFESIIKIRFIEEPYNVKVVFSMDSLYIEKDEREKIFVEGYSGKNAKLTSKNGDGIGMWRIDQMMRLNDGKIEIECGEEIENVMGFKFAKNKFILTFKRYQ